MAETFYGSWFIDVVSKDADFIEQYVIQGSDRSDGTYIADTTTPRVHVSGEQWTLELQWNDNVGSGWQPSRIRRSDVRFTVEDGLVVVVGADDNFEAVADGDFNDVVLRLQNIDRHLIPWHPYRRKVDFTVKDNPNSPSRPDPTGQQIPGEKATKSRLVTMPKK